LEDFFYTSLNYENLCYNKYIKGGEMIEIYSRTNFNRTVVRNLNKH